MKHIDIFCDGSCLDNGKPFAKGGWSYVVTTALDTEESAIKRFGKIRAGKQTNNRAELESMLQALLYIYKEGDDDTFYKIYSDSEIVVQGITGESMRSANRDIWIQIEELCQKLINRFTIVGIKNHKTNNEDYIYIMNNLSDKLAKQGANSLLLEPIQISL